MKKAVKDLLAMQEKLVQSPGREDPLEKEMATIPIFLPGKSDGQESLTDYSPWGHKRVRHDLAIKQQMKKEVMKHNSGKTGKGIFIKFILMDFQVKHSHIFYRINRFVGLNE